MRGVWRVCTGHTWIPQPLRLGNFLALDCTGGGDGPLAIYCIQDDAIYVEGRSVSLDGAESISEQLQELEKVISQLKVEVNSNRLIESQSLSGKAEAFAKRVNSSWITMRDEVAESQKLLNALHGLSLLTGERRAAKLDELAARYRGTQTEQLLQRLFGV